MKKVEAIIRKSKYEDVKNALIDAGIDFFSFWPVRGHGLARQERAYRGVVYDTSIIERLKLSIIVRDQNLELTVNAIINSAQTGEIGDGKIFVIDIEDSYRIRTGERGESTLYIDETI